MAYHTDEFLIKRANNPKWHDEYVKRMNSNRAVFEAEQQRIRQRRANKRDFWIGFIGSLLVGLLLYRLATGANLLNQVWLMLLDLIHG
ncbi:hypothetical protein [Furfurilactobacillus entadae]|uniref:hypothetical protein n=1 Tax=Furfurilactobacillus entadae TaxID=2922307 RepID=UPI0035EEF7A6